MGQADSLALEDSQQIKQELNFHSPDDLQSGSDPELEKKASQLADSLVNFDHKDVDKQAEIKQAVEQMGSQVQKNSAELSNMLKRPLQDLQGKSAEGGEVAKSLIDLKMQVEELDPVQFDFSAGWFSRLLGLLPGIGTPLKRYFSKFEAAQTVINAIINSLEKGKDGLLRDNITLTEDQKRMRDMTLKLEKAIKLGQLIDQKLSYKLERDIEATDPKHKFISEEVLFALRQRIMDLQQQLAVNQQGVLAIEIIIRNNKELVRGVNRALNVTVNALQTAVTVALALENQKIVLDKVNAISKTTDNLIANTAQRLRAQGAEIQKQASSTQLNIDTLKQAFADINAAMDDIAQFRQRALPQMAQSMLEMDELSIQAETSIKRMEEAKKAEPAIKIDID